MAELPLKRPTEHRWITTVAYILTSQQAAAMHRGTGLDLGEGNLLTEAVGIGCWDCEQIYGNHEPECPAGDADTPSSEVIAEIQPVPGDGDLAKMTVEAVGQQHLLVGEVTTSAALVSQGGEGVPVVVLRLDGRFNHTDVMGSQESLLPIDAAMYLRDGVDHTLDFLRTCQNSNDAQ